MSVNLSLVELGTLSVDELIQEAVLTPASSTVSEIIGLLKSRGCYEAFIELRSKVGMVTSRDLLKVTNISYTKVSSLIKYIPRLERKTSLQEGASVMSEHRIRALPIFEGGKIIGQINARSIVEKIGRLKELKRLKAHHVMTANPITVTRETMATKARALMIRRRIDHLPVMNGTIYGIVTSNNILDALLPPDSSGTGARGEEGRRRLDFQVDTLMQNHVLTSRVDDDLSSVVELMLRRSSTYSLVTLLDELQGIITYRDIISLIATSATEEDLPLSIVGLPDDPFESEAVKKKFKDIIRTLRRAYPDIAQASALIKTTSNDLRTRDRYEVNVKVTTPNKIYSYGDMGWNLPSIFDRLSGRMKKIRSAKSSKRRPSIRKS